MIPRLVLLTDRSQLRLGRGLVRTVRECVDAGLEAVVVREHDLPPDARHALVAELAAVDGLLVVSSRIPDPAAHGWHHAAHQPQPRVRPASGGLSSAGALHSVASAGNCSLKTTRSAALTNTTRLQSRSCHTRAEVEAAARDGMAWATLSPYAASASKPGYGPPLPEDAYAGHALPVLALGGITPANAAAARAAGAHGVAVMGGVMRSSDPAAVVADLLRAVA